MPQGADELSLTIAGAANCTDTGQVIRVFLAMVRTAGTIEPHYQPKEPGQLPELRPSDLRGVYGVDPGSLTDEVMYGAFALGLHETCFRGGSHSPDPGVFGWSLNFDRGIRPYAGVHSLGDYWRVRAREVGRARTEAESQPFQKSSEPEPDFAPIPAARPLITTPDMGPAGALSVTCSLHPLIAEVAAERYNGGFYYDAVRSAFQAVEHRVAVLVGATEVGERLMGIAFGAKPDPPKITVTRFTGSSLESEQNGMQFLFKGAMGALRNPRMHGPDEKDARDEADEMLVFASFLMRRLDIEDEKRKAGSSAP
ncbi:uncharacterized protein (TIGR02391 family) [Streptomyces achromogenes]|uniref:Uncharacterized protein (TIGR02391 family) n=1 Tax=Streptomyces achromogenes TaxID=67255 RepID=A0ABU0Q3K0_STRAH|nr:uncharacterized protein (TIGR02391 family) [Streptomyces achromogenes]